MDVIGWCAVGGYFKNRSKLFADPCLDYVKGGEWGPQGMPLPFPILLTFMLFDSKICQIIDWYFFYIFGDVGEWLFVQMFSYR